MAVRNDQIFELLQAMHAELGEMNLHLGKMNGRLGAVEAIVGKLPCSSHSMDLTVLKERVNRQKTNWSRVVNIAFGAGQALFILWLASKFVF